MKSLSWSTLCLTQYKALLNVQGRHLMIVTPFFSASKIQISQKTRKQNSLQLTQRIFFLKDYMQYFLWKASNKAKNGTLWHTGENIPSGRTSPPKKDKPFKCNCFDLDVTGLTETDIHWTRLIQTPVVP